MEKGKVFVVVGRNNLLNIVGCDGVASTKEKAEIIAKREKIDEYRIDEYEIE